MTQTIRLARRRTAPPSMRPWQSLENYGRHRLRHVSQTLSDLWIGLLAGLQGGYNELTKVSATRQLAISRDQLDVIHWFGSILHYRSPERG